MDAVHIAGPPSEFGNALLVGAGWVINLAVAEWVIRKQPAPPARTASAVVSQLMVEGHRYVDQGHKQGNGVITAAYNHNP